LERYASTDPELGTSRPDRDYPLGYNFVHWVIYNISAGTRDCPQGFPRKNLFRMKRNRVSTTMANWAIPHHAHRENQPIVTISSFMPLTLM
jgi:phosphatidylethanolamine-binding protein (PEBP) family uncharacterized protein